MLSLHCATHSKGAGGSRSWSMCAAQKGIPVNANGAFRVDGGKNLRGTMNESIMHLASMHSAINPLLPQWNYFRKKPAAAGNGTFPAGPLATRHAAALPAATPDRATAGRTAWLPEALLALALPRSGLRSCRLGALLRALLLDGLTWLFGVSGQLALLGVWPAAFGFPRPHNFYPHRFPAFAENPVIQTIPVNKINASPARGLHPGHPEPPE